MRHARRPIICEINITPLTDIFLVLLIIMMVITPLLDFTGLNAQLAGAQSEAADEGDTKVIRIDVTAEGAYRVNDAETELADLQSTLRDAAPAHPDGAVISVDAEAPLERMTSVLDRCQAVGISQVSISRAEEATAEP